LEPLAVELQREAVEPAPVEYAHLLAVVLGDGGGPSPGDHPW
jgi:hypothetical protein